METNVRMTYEEQWREKAILLIRDTFRASSREQQDPFQKFLSRLKMLSRADITLLIRVEDAFTAKAIHAFPDYLGDITFTAEEYTLTLETAGDEILYYPHLARVQPPFAELFMAMYSGVILPLPHKRESMLLVLGWSGQQEFTPAFQSFMDLARERIRELAGNYYFRRNTLANIRLMASVFNVLPQALVYIDNDGYTSWINKEAASLLQLSLYGEQATPVVAAALRQLRYAADNRDEIEQKARQIFINTESSVNQWLWRFSEAQRPYKKLCVTTRPVEDLGRIWIFEDITDV